MLKVKADASENSDGNAIRAQGVRRTSPAKRGGIVNYCLYGDTTEKRIDSRSICSKIALSLLSAAMSDPRIISS